MKAEGIMLVKSRRSWELPYSDVTPESVYRTRRDFLRTTAAGTVGLVAGTMLSGTDAAASAQDLQALPNVRKSAYVTDPKVDPQTSYEKITTYNNYYEFGSRKGDPAMYAGRLRVKPWTVKVDGLVDKPGNFGVEDLVDFSQLEERIYRHRCVERWSMVMPFIGVQLSEVLKKVKPQAKAQFVEFTTLERPAEMPGVAMGNLPYPYVEGLRMDEAMHPLAFMVVGLYGMVLPNQTGAPLRVHVPWKYGFKSGKSIVRIRLTDTMPRNTWNVVRANEYGFYANVNPAVDHPRWSQRMEQRLPSLFMNRPTQLFNGYSEVAGLYAGMDLTKFY
jgi:methionine sulfoxide reductase catalytic subunit